MDPPPLDFDAVYDAYHPRVRAYAARLVGPDRADDVAQEVLLKVSRALGGLTDRARLSSWIHAITLNTVRDMARAAAARPIPARESEDLLGRAASSSRDPEQLASRGEMVACYVDYVERLPREHHDVYVLAEFEHLPNVEIARRLGVSLATVKIRLHRARSRLHAELRRNCSCYYNDRGELMGAPRKR